MWLDSVPEYTAIFTTIIILRSLLKCFERPINSVNFAIGNMKPINLFSSFSMICSVLMMFIFFAIGLPPYWAFILDCVSIFCCVLYFMLHAQKYGLFKISYFLNNVLLKILCVIICSLVITYSIRLIPIQEFPRFIVTICTTALSTMILVFYVLLAPSQRLGIINLIESKIHYFYAKKSN